MANALKKDNPLQQGVSKKGTRYHLKFVGNSIWRHSVNEEVLLQSLSQLEGRKYINAVSIQQIKNTRNGGKQFTIVIDGFANGAVKEVEDFKRTIKNLGLTIQSCGTA